MKKLFVNFFKSLDKSTKNNIYLYVLFSFITALLEMIGVGLIYPFANFIFTEDYQILNYIPFNAKLSLINTIYLPFILLLMLVFFFLIKNILLIYINFLLYKFLANIRHNLSCNLFNKYIYFNYDYFLNKNSGEITRNLTTLINDLNSRVIIPSGLFLSEFLILLFTFFIILIINFQASLSLILFFIIPFYFYYKFIKSKLIKYGGIAQTNESLRIDKINQMIGGIKEIKIHNKEDYFIDNYKSYDLNVTKSNQLISTLTQFNKYLLELVLIFALAFLVIYYFFVNSSFNISALMPILSLYVMAAFKLMPSFNRINNSIQTMRWGGNVLKITTNILNTNSKNLNYKLKRPEIFNKHINFTNINFRYKNQKTLVFKNLNLKIKKGSMIGITGDSGSGKTTLLNIILGILLPSSGQIRIDGKKITKNNYQSFKKLIGFVPQDVFLTDSSILSNVAFGIPEDEIDIERAVQCLKNSKIYDYVLSLKNGFRTKVGDRGIRLSGGQKQRIAIARSLYHGAQILVFDEATSALDYSTESEIMKTINSLENKYTIIIVAHRLNTLSKCNLIYKVKNQKLSLDRS
tara:strand:- start:20148 stop:21878 length:1731 start_codon:yes stop_codon:yes gene_type:complete